MLTLTESAQTQVLEYFKENEIKPVRVFLNSGCGGEQLALAVDDQQPDDTVHTFGELTFLVSKSLLEKARPISIDFGMEGFTIGSNLELTSGCGGCGSSGACCS